MNETEGLVHISPRAIESFLDRHPRPPSSDIGNARNVAFETFPPIAPAYYALLRELHDRPPTFGEFFARLAEGKNKFLMDPDWMARASNAYAGIVAEHHFACLVHKDGSFDGTFTDVHLDMAHGVDLVVHRRKDWDQGISKARYVGVNLSRFSTGLASPENAEFKRKKEWKRDRFVPDIEAHKCGVRYPFDPSDVRLKGIVLTDRSAQVVGNVHLTTEAHVGLLKDWMYSLEYWVDDSPLAGDIHYCPACGHALRGASSGHGEWECSPCRVLWIPRPIDTSHTPFLPSTELKRSSEAT